VAFSTSTSRRTSALADGAALDLQEKHRHQSPRAARALHDRRRQYRFLFVTKGGGPPTSRSCTRTAAILNRERLLRSSGKGEDTGTAASAVSSRDRHRRHVGEVTEMRP
jgi:hypothetical protein